MIDQQLFTSYARRGALARVAELQQEMAQLQAWLNGSGPESKTRPRGERSAPTHETPLG